MLTDQDLAEIEFNLPKRVKASSWELLTLESLIKEVKELREDRVSLSRDLMQYKHLMASPNENVASKDERRKLAREILLLLLPYYEAIEAVRLAFKMADEFFAS